MIMNAAYSTAGESSFCSRGRLRAGVCALLSLVEPVLEVLFPPRCVGCGDFEWHVCPACREELRPIGENSCPRCGNPGPVALLGGRCRECMSDEFWFSGARAAFLHQGVASRLVTEFKFGGQVVLGRTMAELAGSAFGAFLDSLPDPERVLVTWVPSSSRAERARGYNQAEVLAKALAVSRPSLTTASLVRKTRNTRHQKELDRATRQKNLVGAFAMEDGWWVHIPSATRALVLVDDVFTTGATAQEVSSVLNKITGLPVYVFTFSRAVGGGNEGHD